VLGRLIEVVSGMDFDQFVADRITRPLHMPDTAFYLPESQAQRLAVQDAKQDAKQDSSTAVPATKRPNFVSGGGGLFSTAMDYARFCQMMLNGGELDGFRLLSPKTVALMAADSLPPATSRESELAVRLGAFGPTLEMGQSFGLGFAIRTDAGRNPLPGSIGEYYWMGITGTPFWVDPPGKVDRCIYGSGAV
jgi:CubicO group peptidase (beta-lactamase class C family)